MSDGSRKIPNADEVRQIVAEEIERLFPRLFEQQMREMQLRLDAKAEAAGFKNYQDMLRSLA